MITGEDINRIVVESQTKQLANENRKIFEWMGEGCWHEMVFNPDYEVKSARYECPKCGHQDFNGTTYNPNYTTPEGFISLLEGVGAKGYHYILASYDGPLENHTPLYCLLSDHDSDIRSRGDADTPQQALRLAVLKLITEGK